MAESSRLDELRRRVQQDPASIAFAALAEEYRRARRYRDAVDTSRAGLRHHPGYISARLTLGRSLIEMHDYEPAERELAVVLRSAPDNLAARRAMGELYWQQLRFADALHHYRTALALVPRDTELPAIVHALEQELEAEEAARVAEQAAESASAAVEQLESLTDEAHEGEPEGGAVVAADVVVEAVQGEPASAQAVSVEAVSAEALAVEAVATEAVTTDAVATAVVEAQDGEAEAVATDAGAAEAARVAAAPEAAQTEGPQPETGVVEISEVAEPAPVAPLEDLEASVEFTLADDLYLEEELITAGAADSAPLEVEPIRVEPIQVEPIQADPELSESVADAPTDFLLASTEPDPAEAALATVEPAPASFESVTAADLAQVLVEARGLLALERLHASLRHEQARREQARAPRRAMTA